SEQRFSVENYWSKTQATVTDFAGNAPNGEANASRVQFQSGVSYITSVGVLGSGPGTYTASLYVKSNDGNDHNVRLQIIPTTGSGVLGGNVSVANSDGWKRV